MGIVDAIPIIGPALDAAAGVASAHQARSAFTHRYQDTVADMRKAGLNPALAYGQGGGNPQTSDLPDVGSSLTRAAQSTASAKQAEAERKKTEAETKLLNAQAGSLELQPGLINERIRSETHAASNLAAFRAWLSDSERTRSFIGRDTMSAVIRRALAEAEGAELSLPERRAYAKYYKSPMGRAEPYLNQGAATAKDINDIISTYFGPGAAMKRGIAEGARIGRTFRRR